VIDTRSGHLWEVLPIPTFTERGREWGVQLGYASYAAAPSFTISTTTDYNSTRPIERTVYRFQVEGRTVEAFYGATQNNQKPVGNFFWDGRDANGDLMPTGSYDYSIDVTSLNANSPVAISNVYGGSPSQVFSGITFPGLVPLRAPTSIGRAVLVNLADSVYGAGWSVIGESRLHFDPDGCIVLVHSNAQADLFVPNEPGGNEFTSPAGDFSALRRLPDGTYIRSFVDGSLDLYSAIGRIVRSTDRYGYVTTYTYDPQGRLASIVSPVGNAQRFFYDISGTDTGRLTRIVDSAGRTTLIDINQSGQLVAMVDAVGGARSFTYDPEHRMTGQSGSRGERTEYLYDNTRVKEVRSYDVANGPLLRTRQFDSSQRRGEIGGALASGLGHVIETPIPPVTDRRDRYTDGRGGVTTWETNPRGLVTQVTDPIGRVTKYVYDANYLMTSVFRPNNTEVRYAYNGNGDMTRATEVLNGAQVNVEYNGPFGLATRVVDQVGNASAISYYPNGNAQTITDPNLGITAIFYEDSRFADLPTRFVDAEGGTTRFEYNARGNVSAVIDPLSRGTSFGYDLAGNTQAVTNASQYTTTFVYDALNRPVSSTDPELATTTMTYADLGCGCGTSNLTRVILPNGSSVSYTYDGLDRAVSVTDQGDRVTTFAYDPEGALTQTTLRDGEALLSVNDELGRRIRVVSNATGRAISSFEYDVLGNLTAANNDVSAVTMAYDSIGRQISETQRVALPPALPLTPDDEAESRLPVSSSITYEHDNANRLIRRVYGSGEEVFRYDTRGLVREIEYSDAQVSPVQWSMLHDGLGRTTEIVFPNDVTQSFVYDAANQLAALELVRNADQVVLDRFEYSQYSLEGRLLSVSRTRGGGDPSSWSYAYSPAGRLLQATIESAPVNVSAVSQAVVFDSDGRMTSLDGGEVEHDSVGRLIALPSKNRNTLAMEWNAFGELVGVIEIDENSREVMKARYWHDALGRRLASEVNGLAKVTAYDGWQPVARIELATGDRERFISGLGVDQYLAVIEPDGAIRHMHQDRLRSLVALTSADGALAGWTEVSPFGSVIQSTSSVTNAGFTGLPLDPESGFVASRYRMLIPSIGRFASEDPIGLAGGINLFAYVGGDPVNGIDPYGLSYECTYSQSTGQMTCVDSNGGPPVSSGGYSGTGPGRNNPASQCVPNVGPIPTGTYTIGTPFNSSNTGPGAIPLTPNPGTDTCGRGNFQIHDNNRSNDASRGCIILPRGPRGAIGEGGGTVIVVP